MWAGIELGGHAISGAMKLAGDGSAARIEDASGRSETATVDADQDIRQLLGDDAGDDGVLQGVVTKSRLSLHLHGHLADNSATRQLSAHGTAKVAYVLGEFGRLLVWLGEMRMPPLGCAAANRSTNPCHTAGGFGFC